MDDTQELRELLHMAKAIEPLVEAYKNDQLTKEERIFLESVAEVMIPVLWEYLNIMWKDFEPLLIRFGLWPPKEDDD